MMDDLPADAASIPSAWRSMDSAPDDGSAFVAANKSGLVSLICMASHPWKTTTTVTKSGPFWRREVTTETVVEERRYWSTVSVSYAGDKLGYDEQQFFPEGWRPLSDLWLPSAQAIEARSGEIEGLDPKGESAGAKPCAQGPEA